MQAVKEAEYEAYLRARLPQLHRAAYLLCGDAHLSDDLVQATALSLYRHWRRVHSADNPDAYVHRMLVNEFLGHRRRSWSRVLLSGRQVDQDAAAATAGPEAPDPVGLADRDEVRTALAQLGARQRAVLVLRFYCDLSVEQTAAALGCSAGTVKSQTSRGLATMRRLLGDGEQLAPCDTGKGSGRA